MRSHTQILVALLLALLIADPARGDETSHAKHPTRHSTQEQKPFGVAGDKRHVTRTVRIRMLDEMRFVPDRFDVREGDTVRLVVDNTGKLMHELVIGTKKDLDAHAATMDAGMTHDEPYIAHVPPGKRGEVIWTFNRAGRFDFACLVPGHYQSGMVGSIDVTAR
jgi:uncharacterized cupredoxin-like copper-binding protein